MKEELIAGRNDLCPCGSGLKYKRCCMLNQRSPHDLSVADLYLKNYRIKLKTAKDIAGIKKAGKLVVDTLWLAKEFIRPGVTTNDINRLVHEYTIKNGARPAPLNYRGYPKSTCTSVNEVICHGIPSDRVLLEGDIVNVDVTSILEEYYADANMTFFVGECREDAHKIVNIARESLKRALTAVKPDNTIGDIGHEIQRYAEGQGASVVREFIGHGIGKVFHEPPDIPHFGKPHTGITLVPGMVFTIEPMVNLGKRFLRVLDDQWTAVTRDGSLSAQFEQTIVVTENGYEVLTPYDL
ncbi:MAG: type I methionyl aminopeptidase [Candidatus Riflebacteria bacterium HGW-Riflebacteria-2]|jgi:methionyl aminopeptidase|nr:MAG: type I methionyl aminopeptidase [Candidatus Riflebacteria bacterium HGW-Riflebacteria-2]